MVTDRSGSEYRVGDIVLVPLAVGRHVPDDYFYTLYAVGTVQTAGASPEIEVTGRFASYSFLQSTGFAFDDGSEAAIEGALISQDLDPPVQPGDSNIFEAFTAYDAAGPLGIREGDRIVIPGDFEMSMIQADGSVTPIAGLDSAAIIIAAQSDHGRSGSPPSGFPEIGAFTLTAPAGSDTSDLVTGSTSPGDQEFLAGVLADHATDFIAEGYDPNVAARFLDSVVGGGPPALGAVGPAAAQPVAAPPVATPPVATPPVAAPPAVVAPVDVGPVAGVTTPDAGRSFGDRLAAWEAAAYERQDRLGPDFRGRGDDGRAGMHDRRGLRPSTRMAFDGARQDNDGAAPVQAPESRFAGMFTIDISRRS